MSCQNLIMLNINDLLTKQEATEFLSRAIDNNNVLASGNVKNAFRNHYTDLNTGINGIGKMLEVIFAEANAIAPKGCEETKLRTMAIGISLYFDEIVAQVRAKFGYDRYTDMSIRTYLTSQKSDKLGAKITAIQLTKFEDKSGSKPRTKYYWNQ